MLQEAGLSLALGLGIGRGVGVDTFKADVHKARAPAGPSAETQSVP